LQICLASSAGCHTHWVALYRGIFNLRLAN
jgi:hypothetical protein